MVVVSYEAYEKLRYETGVFQKLKEAEAASAETSERFSHTDVMSGIREKLAKACLRDV